MKKLTEKVISKPKFIILIALLLLIPSLIGYVFTSVNYDILSYLPGRLDSVKGQKVLSETYNVDSTTMVIVENMRTTDVVKLKNKISNVENVASVLWYNDLIDPSIPADILPDEIKNIFFSQDGNYTMMFVQFTPDSTSEDTIKAIGKIKKVTQKQCLLSGLTPINADTKELTNKELPIYILLAVAFMLIILFLTMESLVMPIILLVVLGISVAINMGTNWIFGGISYITQCVAVILQLAVTMDYMIFVINRYGEERIYNSSKEDAMRRTIEASMVSLKGSSITTLFGFIALCFMQLKLGFNIGMVMAKGVLIGVLTAMTVLPAFLLVFDDKIYKKKHKVFAPNFDKLIDAVVKHKKVFTVIFVILLIPAIILAANVNQYYNITSTLPEDFDSIVALNTLKEEFNMTTTHFIVVHDDVSAEKLIEMENRISKLDGITSLLAYNQFVGSSIPDSIIPDDIIKVVKQGGYEIMMVNSEFEAATDPANEQVEAMYSIVKEYDPKGYITGEGAMYSEMVGITVTDFTITSIISILAIFIVIAVLFKSYVIPVILILSIEFAILINESISTVIGTPISFFAPTVISCVQLGATVDYAILLTSRYREELQNGKDNESAIRIAAKESMHSVFQSALIFFVVTIGVYMVSSIHIVKELCSLLARGSIISALIIVFVLIPLLLVSDKFIKKYTKVWVKEADNGNVQNDHDTSDCSNDNIEKFVTCEEVDESEES